jgi:hypothetical protein
VATVRRNECGSRGVLELISANFDRISDLSADYEGCAETKLRVKLSTELRLLETAVARGHTLPRSDD